MTPSHFYSKALCKARSVIGRLFPLRFPNFAARHRLGAQRTLQRAPPHLVIASEGVCEYQLRRSPPSLFQTDCILIQQVSYRPFCF